MQIKTGNKLVILLAFCFFVVFYSFTTAPAAEKSVLKGRVLDIEGKAVESARVFIYSSADVRRQSDFMSAYTDKDGRFHIILPHGKYHAVARLKKTEGYGPLMPGDKHSGEAREVMLASGMELEVDFTVLNLKEAGRANKWIREDFFKISGRIINEKGIPVKMAYVFANRGKDASGVPDYLSAWTDEDGHYTLYLPRGRYYVGTAVTFPPGEDGPAEKDMVVESDKQDENIVSRAF